MVMEERRGARLGRAWEGTAQAQTSLSAYRRSCWVPGLLHRTCPASVALYYPVYSGSVKNPLPLPPPPLSHCEHEEGLTANMQRMHTLREATQPNTHCAYSSHTTRARGVYFSLHSRRALCPLPSALSSYQVVLVSTEATGVPIPLFPGLASQACKCLPPTGCPSTP